MKKNSILSIQSHVVYGYVGNKAATYPLQSMGYDVWPIHTVQFSNHTGYPQWQGDIFDAKPILKLVDGLFEIDQQHRCQAILSGYMGSLAICEAVQSIVKKFKAYNPSILYLCDPVIGNTHCYVKPEVFQFFKDQLNADIITPNQYEAEQLSGMLITDKQSLKAVANFFHEKGIAVVAITGLIFKDSEDLHVFVSDQKKQWLVQTRSFHFDPPLSGTGDLFSSVFLGTYLKKSDAGLALQTAVFYLEKVLLETQKQKERELQILSVRYDRVAKSQLPLLTAF